MAEGGTASPERLPCRCGHFRSVHEHYRAGTECGVCGPEVCPRFRPRWRERVSGWRSLLRRSR